MNQQHTTGLDEQAAQSTISERLRNIDKGAWGEIENPNGTEYHMNIGLFAHQAADEIERLKKIMAELGQDEIKTPKWEQSPEQIASEIADGFYQVTSLFHADLRRQIIKAIEEEREVAKHYMTQMGRWWERLQSKK